MKSFFAKLPTWRQVTVVISIFVIASAAFIWWYIATDMYRPVAQMPWYYWLIIALLLIANLYILVNPKSVANRIYEQGVLLSIVSMVILVTSIFNLIDSLFNGSTTGHHLFAAVLWLLPGITAVKTLYQKWRLRHNRTALR